MIDLHMHTTYSDGADDLITVLKKAEALKLKYISITDHDNCNAYKELSNINVKEYFKGQIIPGVEIKCSYKKRLIEVLGYKINVNVINEYMDEYNKTHSKSKLQQKYFDILYKKCKEMGLILKEKESIDFDSKRDWASLKIYQEIKCHDGNREKLPQDLWSEFNVFSKKYCGDVNYPLYIDKSKDYMTVEDAIKLIKKAGGLVFLPHIFIYKWSEDKYRLLDELVSNYDIDGIECMHSEFNQSEIDYLMNYTKENNLYRSGGSDYHGTNKVGIDMAIGKGNLKIQEEIIKDWINN